MTKKKNLYLSITEKMTKGFFFSNYFSNLNIVKHSDSRKS